MSQEKKVLNAWSKLFRTQDNKLARKNSVFQTKKVEMRMHKYQMESF